MSKIVFQKSGLSDLTLEHGRSYPTSIVIEVNQERYLTEDFKPKVIDFGSSHETMVIKLEGISKDNIDGAINGLRTWFEASQVTWALNSFTMINERGINQTIRWWDKSFKIKEVSPNRYDVSFIVKVE